MERASREINVGDSVIYTDENRNDHNALIQCVHGDSYLSEKGTDVHPCVNLVFVVGEQSMTDKYGRQIEHKTSVVHASDQTGGGMCWRFSDEQRPKGQAIRS